MLDIFLGILMLLFYFFIIGLILCKTCIEIKKAKENKNKYRF